jgi:cobalt-zinc-cadmium efflux system membrane fusion protein
LRVVQVSPSARSRIEGIEVAVGEPVRTGQRLAVVDNFDLSEARSRVATAKAALAQATVEAATAQTALTRGLDLVRIGGAAESDLERRRAEAARMQAELRTRQAELQQWQGVEQRLMPIAPGDVRGVASAEPSPDDSRAALISPIDGVIDSIHASSGEIVDISRQVFTVADLSTVWVQADVPERDLGAIREGEAVTVGVDAYPGRAFTGRVAYIADQLDPRTGTAKVRCEVPNPDRALRVNMFATVEIASPLGRDAILVPDAALQDVNGQKAVFVPAGSGRFVWHAVRPGISSGGFTELLQGVATGTQVVADGSFWLKAALMRETIPDEG